MVNNTILLLNTLLDSSVTWLNTDVVKTMLGLCLVAYTIYIVRSLLK